MLFSGVILSVSFSPVVGPEINLTEYYWQNLQPDLLWLTKYKKRVPIFY
jgi:hypothetical protein